MINGKQAQFDLIQTKEGSFHLIKDNRSYNVEVIEANAEEKTFSLKVNNRIYEASVEDRFDLLLHQFISIEQFEAGEAFVRKLIARLAA